MLRRARTAKVKDQIVGKHRQPQLCCQEYVTLRRLNYWVKPKKVAWTLKVERVSGKVFLPDQLVSFPVSFTDKAGEVAL
jgi:hypothetical protein